MDADAWEFIYKAGVTIMGLTWYFATYPVDLRKYLNKDK